MNGQPLSCRDEDGFFYEVRDSIKISDHAHKVMVELIYNNSINKLDYD